MILHVLDPNLNYMGRLSNFRELSWTEEYSGKGAFSMTVDDTDTTAKMIQCGSFFYRSDAKTCMWAVSVVRNGEQKTIQVGGYGSIHMLEHRAIRAKVDCSKYDSAEAAVLYLFNTYKGDLPVIAGEPSGASGKSSLLIEYTSLFDGIHQIAAAGEHGIRFTLDYPNKRHVFQFYNGIDRGFKEGQGGVVFSQEFGNMRSLTITEDDDIYKNVAIAVGQYTNESTVLREYPPSVQQQAGINRREIIFDAGQQSSDQTNQQYLAALDAECQETLQEYYRVQTFKAEIDQSRLKKDFSLGDIVTCKSSRFGLRFNTRITQVKETVSNGVYRVSLTLGNPTITYLQGAMMKHG